MYIVAMVFKLLPGFLVEEAIYTPAQAHPKNACPLKRPGHVLTIEKDQKRLDIFLNTQKKKNVWIWSLFFEGNALRLA